MTIKIDAIVEAVKTKVKGVYRIPVGQGFFQRHRNKDVMVRNEHVTEITKGRGTVMSEISMHPLDWAHVQDVAKEHCTALSGPTAARCLCALREHMAANSDAYPVTATEVQRKMNEKITQCEKCGIWYTVGNGHECKGIELKTDTPHEQIMAKLDQIMEMAKNSLVGVAGWGKKFGDQSDEFWEGYKARDEEARGNL